MKYSIYTLFTIGLLLTFNDIAAQIPNLPDKPEVVFVEGGSFKMGSNYGDKDEKPIHKVTIDNFNIGKYPVSVSQYMKFCEATGRKKPDMPSWGWNDRAPIVNVTHDDGVAYCEWLSKEYGGEWRLPTEAEWEFAAQGGNNGHGFKYSGSNDLVKVGWYADNSGELTGMVGEKKPNELGIYDMSGNVWEWCADWYASDYYSKSPESNPQGPASGLYHVLRGCSWASNSSLCRLSNRSDNKSDYRSNTYGFRVVLNYTEDQSE